LEKKLEEAKSDVIIATLKGEKGDKGDSGKNGTDGKDGTNSTSTKETIVKEVPLKGEQGEAGAAGRETEFRYNETKQRIEWRYIGDSGWQILVKKCTLLADCVAP